MQIPILISACLLGVPCRYDGKSVPSEAVKRILKRKNVRLIPVCPEVAGGLTTPRIPSERIGDEVTMKSGRTVTQEYRLGAETALRLAREHGCRLAILKEKSPSCGTHLIYDGTFSGVTVQGQGVTAQTLTGAGITLLSEGDLEKMEEWELDDLLTTHT